MKSFKEGLVAFKAPAGKISRELDVFYNPDKKFDRDLNIFLMKHFVKRYSLIDGLDVLSATGIRGLRLAKECGLKMSFNDYNPLAVKLIKKNAEENSINAEVFNLDANQLLFFLKKKFDYVDIDPFGPPVPFLEGAVRVLKNKGILAVTATDSSALCGSYPKACLRKYGSKPLKTDYCHELGIRILIKTVVEAGAKFDIALSPIFSYSRKDYFRIYFLKESGAKRADELLKEIGFFFHNTETLERGIDINGSAIGKLWLGPLWDFGFMKSLDAEEFEKPEFIKLLREECIINSIGFFHLPGVYSLMKRTPEKIENIIAKIKAEGFHAGRTHFDAQGLRTNAGIADLIRILE